MIFKKPPYNTPPQVASAEVSAGNMTWDLELTNKALHYEVPFYLYAVIEFFKQEEQPMVTPRVEFSNNHIQIISLRPLLDRFTKENNSIIIPKIENFGIYTVIIVLVFTNPIIKWKIKRVPQA
jgi:ABC-type transport system substrate-binding protein